MRLLPLLFIGAFIYIESVLFVSVAEQVGVAFTLLLTLFTSIVGISLVRNKGLHTMMVMQQKLVAGESPAKEMLSSASLVLAGFLLLIPGFFTDFLGLLLMLPLVQRLLAARILPHVTIIGQGHSSFGSTSSQDTHTFEGEFERKPDRAPPVIEHDDDQNNDLKK